MRLPVKPLPLPVRPLLFQGKPMRFLSHNWHIKLLCLVGAILLAVFVRKQENVLQRNLVLPIILTPPVGQRVVDPPRGASVEVELEGPSNIVRAIQDTDLKLVIDTSAVRPGQRMQVPVLVEVPDKFRRVMVSWRPRSIGVRYVSDTSKEFPVVVKPLKPLDDWELVEAPRAQPDRVTVSGTEDVVSRVAAVTAVLPLEPEEAINTLVTLQALDAENNNITDQVQLAPPQVMVTGAQQRVLLQTRLKVQADWHIPPDARIADVEVTPPRVLVTGPRRLVSNLDVLDTETVTVPPGKTEYSQTVTLVVPDSRLDVSPRRVRVTIRLVPPQDQGNKSEPSHPRGTGTESTPPRNPGGEPAAPRTGTNDSPGSG